MLEPDPIELEVTSAIIELRSASARVEETVRGADSDAYDDACNDYWDARDRAERLGIL